MVSDIKRTFLKVSFGDNDRDYLQMIWFDNNEFASICKVGFWTDIKRFCPKWYGKTHLEKFLSDNQKKYVIIKLLRDSYVDYVTISFDSINEGIQFFEISKSCLLKGQFVLRKWITNEQKLQLFIDAKENENIVKNGKIWESDGFTLVYKK